MSASPPSPGPVPRAVTPLRTRVLEPGDPALDRLGGILTDRFPAGERDDWDTQLERHRAGKLVIAAAEHLAPDLLGTLPHQGGSRPRPPRQRTPAAPVGVAVVALLPRTQSAALLYLASATHAPANGVGLSLMTHLRVHLEKIGVTRGFLGEIERVEEARDAADAVVRHRRLRYYLRFGAEMVAGVPSYGMPDMTSGALLPLHLVWLPAGTATDDVRGELLDELITELYEVAYDRPADDPLLAQVLRSRV